MSLRTTKHTAPVPNPDANAREFVTELKFRYHQYRHCDEAVETEIREIVAGRRSGTIRLRHLRQRRDEAATALDACLTTIITRKKAGDKRLAELLNEKFGHLNDGHHVPLETE